MQQNNLSLLFLCFILLGAGCVQPDTQVNVTDTSVNQPTESPISTMTYAFPGILSDEQIENKQVRITTEKGDIVFTLFADTAPKTVSNFVYLANQGYFDGLTFHRRVEGFVIQGGDPNGNGTGGPGYDFEDELDDNRTYIRGIVAMANSGADTNGSQFFVMLADYPLPKNYSIFGEVTAGMDVVDAIVIGDKMTKVSVEDAK